MSHKLTAKKEVKKKVELSREFRLLLGASWAEVDDAAYFGNADAQAVLASRFQSFSEPRALELARFWFEKSAAQNHSIARESLADLARIHSELLPVGQAHCEHPFRTGWNLAKLSMSDCIGAVRMAFPEVVRVADPSQALGCSGVAKSSIASPIFLLGDGPFPSNDLGVFLARLGLHVKFTIPSDEGESTSESYSTDPPIFVLGRSNVPKATRSSLIESAAFTAESFWKKVPGKILIYKYRTKVIDQNGNLTVERSKTFEWPRMYSQELFLLRLLTGRDPFVDSSFSTSDHKKGHPVFACLDDECGFRWPTTEVGLAAGAAMPVEQNKWPKIGLLGHMGYRVGEAGCEEAKRRKILTEAFLGINLPEVISPEYMAKWGKASSARRLEEMAVSIATFCRLNKRRSTPSESAILNWETDLAWLKIEYYDGQFNRQFKWPPYQD